MTSTFKEGKFPHSATVRPPCGAYWMPAIFYTVIGFVGSLISQVILAEAVSQT